ncbi:MAG: type II secretion system F family protein [Casimicrobiaceae bacterium]|nr:type II secretion system F family protein [Casimicrobiaceae bacterium]MDW8312281.1 type II secretion system F family protein [Burkholderiales bacterium]
MTLFAYQAVRTDGVPVSAQIDAPSEREAIERVREQGLILISLVPAAQVILAPGRADSAWLSRLLRSRRVTQAQIVATTRDLANLVGAGLPLDRAFELLVSLAETRPLAVLLQDLRDRVRSGQSLSQALAEHPKHFDRLYVNLVRAGEASGTLGPTLARLAEFQERSAELRSSVQSALIYPVVLVLVALAAVLTMLFYVVPKFEATFRLFGKGLPAATENLLAFSRFLKQDGWLLLLGLMAVVILVRGRLRTPRGELWWHRRKLTLPVLGPLFQRIEVARLTRTLGTLLGNGVSLLPALGIVRDTVENRALANALDTVIVRLREGQGFSRPLLETGLFPKLAAHMVAVGEETGQLDRMLIKIADIYDGEVATALKRALALLEPVLIIVLAVVVGGIIYALLTALLGLTDFSV